MTTATAAANGTSSTKGKELPAGIYCPTVTFFKDTPKQELDVELFSKHMEFLAKAGLNGVTVQGSTGEAVALSREERKQLIRAAKDAFIKCSNPGSVIAGTVGAQSTWEAIQLSQDAAEAGADFVLILPPSYFPAAMTPDAIQGFFEEVADASPIPVVVYSYPAVSSGINMDSDLIMRLAKHPNICGVKHTDHDIGRIARESRVSYGSPFTVLGGASDYLLGTIAYGGKGAITGITNIAPRATAKVYELALSGQHAEAQKLAGEISKAEWTMGKGAILGVKYSTMWANGYPANAAVARRPLGACPEATKKHVEEESADLLAIERQLEKEGYVGLGLRGGSTKVAANGVSEANGHVEKEKGGLLESIKQKVAAL